MKLKVPHGICSLVSEEGLILTLQQLSELGSLTDAQHVACLAKTEFSATMSCLFQRLSPLLEMMGTILLAFLPLTVFMH